MARKIGLVVLVLLIVVGFVKRESIINLLKGERVERTSNKSEVRLLFRTDPSFSEILDALKAKGVISKEEKLLKYIEENSIDTTNFAGGKYLVLTGTSLSALMDGFQKDENGRGKKEVLVNVIFNNCRDVYDIASNISQCIAADSTELVDHILDPKTLKKYQFTEKQIPALFLPRKYEMEFDVDAEGFVAFMAERFKEFWNEERMLMLKEVGLSYPSQAATLASIVYSEQGKVKEEWPIIAGLYLNRIRTGQKLQSDPTFKFCWGDQLDGVQRLTIRHREIDCEYNTYKINGLPPGPICVTPASVIEAVLNPAKVDYIFMCAKPNYSGEHNFTASGAQHAKNARAYQKWLAAELKKKR